METSMDVLLSARRRAIVQGLGGAALLAGCGRPPRGAGAPAAFEFRGLSMGSAYTLKIGGAPLPAAAREAARAAVQYALDRVEDAMSTFRPASELSRFNAWRGERRFALSPDTYAVIALAQQIAAETQGAFDITVAPLVDAWGFGPGRRHRVVGGDEIRTLERQVGFRHLVLDARSEAASKALPGLRADLSGIAKGYGVDAAARALERLGFEDYLVDAGSEIRTRGRNPAGEAWKIAIEEPDSVPPRARRLVSLSGASIATSGDYRIYFERNAIRYCHEIDPASGAPIRNGLASVSVVDPGCDRADAMATALMVMGPRRGFAFACEQRIAACFVVRNGDGSLQDRLTPGFEGLVRA
jgi:thiamine biosynthesis lipoprotein